MNTLGPRPHSFPVAVIVNRGPRSAIASRAIKGVLLLLIGSLILPIHAEEAARPRLNLSIRDCLLMALENNLEISIERLNPLMSEAAIEQARGEFDPALVFTPSFLDNSQPLDAQASVAAGGRQATKSRTSSLSTSLEGKVPFGTQYNFGLQTSDNQSTFNSFKDQYTSFWGLSLTQPILRGFGFASQLAPIRIARKQKEISEEAFAEKVIDIVTRIKLSYFNLIFAIENQQVQVQALELASKLLKDNRRRVEIGVMAPLEVTQSESGVASREEDLLLANQEVNIRVNELRSLISQDAVDLRGRSLWPTDHPTEIPLSPLAFDEALALAIEERPDYQQALKFIEQKHIQLKFDENARYPQLDLKGTYGYNGIGPNLSESISSRDEKWSVGLAVRLPLPDQAGQGRLTNSVLQEERALLELKLTEQSIVREVDDALQAVQTAFNRIRATRAAIHGAEEALAAENSKLKVGTSTSFVILELQKQLADARSRGIRALVDYNIAIALLQKALGTSLSANDIETVPR